jgi:hypothetical protein
MGQPGSRRRAFYGRVGTEELDFMSNILGEVLGTYLCRGLRRSRGREPVSDGSSGNAKATRRQGLAGAIEAGWSLRRKPGRRPLELLYGRAVAPLLRGIPPGLEQV